MRISRLIAVVLVLIFLAVSVFADEIITDYRLVPQHPRGVERVTNFDPRVQNYGWETIVYLEPPVNKPIIGRGYSDRRPQGTARVSSNQWYNTRAPQGGVTIKVKEMDSADAAYSGDKKYEGWLVDEDSGYWLSVGVFSTDHFGNGRLNTATAPIGTMPEKQKLFHSLDLYDSVAVTLELYPDSDPRPSVNVALYGKISKPKFVVPKPTVQQKLWGSNVYFKSSNYANTAANLPAVKKPVERKLIYDAKLRQWVST